MNGLVIPQKFPTKIENRCKYYEFESRSGHQPFVLWVS